MLLNISDLSNEPLQSQIVRQIRAKILTEDLEAGSALPSIRALASEQRVSVITIQRAYERLERAGLIHSRARKGFFVAESSIESKGEIARSQLKEKLAPVIQAARAEGLSRDEIIDIVDQVMGQGVTS